jgi:hypothetical protein
MVLGDWLRYRLSLRKRNICVQAKSADRKVILYISMSLDGFIETKDNSLEFLSIVELEGEDYG